MSWIFKRILSLLLSLILLLTGCPLQDDGDLSAEFAPSLPGTSAFSPHIPAQTGDGYTHFSEMVYTRPDLDRLQALADDAASLASAGKAGECLEAVDRFFEAYDRFYTCYSLADIHYSADLTSTYWADEYEYCSSCGTRLSAIVENLYAELGSSSIWRKLEQEYFGTGFFEDYDGESFYDDTLIALMDQETELQTRYYAIQPADLELGSEEFFDACADEMAGVLADLIRVRNRIADHCGYDSYEAFANDYYYYRDYTSEEIGSYLEEIRKQLVPLYRIHYAEGVTSRRSTEAGTRNFVRKAASNMGGTPAQAFDLMEQAGLWDIGYGANKYNSSFEVYLDSYQEPFVFMNPEMTRYDCLTLAHEFGHFCNDFASDGSQAGLDVLEIFSQGMEYLCLFYGEDCRDLIRLKLADSLCTYVEQACYARFEQEMYLLPESKLNPMGLYDLYGRIAAEYGFDAYGVEPRDFVTVTHFYTNPMYIISYVVSNDAAMQLYELELQEQGSGLQRYEDHLDTEEAYFLAFLEEAELESPFAPGRLERIRQLFENTL